MKQYRNFLFALSATSLLGLSAYAEPAPVEPLKPSASHQKPSPEAREGKRAERHEKLKNASPEDRAKFKEAHADRAEGRHDKMKERWEKASPEEREKLKEAHHAKMKERWEKASPEQREKMKAEHHARMEERLKRMSPEQRAHFKEKMEAHRGGRPGGHHGQRPDLSGGGDQKPEPVVPQAVEAH